MGNPNTTSRRMWAYESTPGTSDLTGVDAIAYEFGYTDESMGEWEFPTIENVVGDRGIWAERNRTTVDLGRNFTNFKVKFNPTTAQPFLWIFGTGSSGATQNISILNTGQQRTISVRYEESGGTNPDLIQMNGCYCVSLYYAIEDDNPMIVECEFAPQSMQDINDVNIITRGLTGMGGVSGYFIGHPKVYYDVAGSNVLLTGAFKVEGMISQIFKSAKNSDTSQRLGYKYSYEKPSLIMWGVLDSGMTWNTHRDRTPIDISVTVYKADMDKYVTLYYHNCRSQLFKKSSTVYRGHTLTVQTFVADWVSGVHNFEGSNYSDHFKGAV